MRVSDKQRYVYDLGRRPARHTFIVGPYGTGKTFWALRGIIRWMTEYHGGGLAMAGCKTRDIWREMITTMITDFCGDAGLECRARADSVEVASALGTPNRVIPVIYGEGDLSANRIRSLSFIGGLIDEATLVTRPVRQQIIARTRGRGDLKLVWTMNPDSPHHPIRSFIDAAVADGDGEEINLGLADNPGVTPEYVRQIMRAHPAPHERARYVHGRWASPSGLIFGALTGTALSALPDDAAVVAWHVWIDWAAKTTTHALLCAETPHGLWICDEWVHDAERSGVLSPPKQVEHIKAHFGVGAQRSISSWVYDQSAGALGQVLVDTVSGQVVPSEGTWEDAVRDTQILLDVDRMLHLDPRCAVLLGELDAYRYPPAAEQARRQSLRPAKTADHGWHGVDAMIYGCAALTSRRARRTVRLR